MYRHVVINIQLFPVKTKNFTCSCRDLRSTPVCEQLNSHLGTGFKLGVDWEIIWPNLETKYSSGLPFFSWNLKGWIKDELRHMCLRSNIEPYIDDETSSLKLGEYVLKARPISLLWKVITCNEPGSYHWKMYLWKKANHISFSKEGDSWEIKQWTCFPSRSYWSFTHFSSVQLLSCVRLFATPWTTARQASLSITNSQSPPKPISIESTMPSSHLILHCPLLFLPSIFSSIRVFSNESALHIRWPKYRSFSFNIKSGL